MGEARDRVIPVRPWDIHVPIMVSSESWESPPSVTSFLSHPEACSRQKGGWETDLLGTRPSPVSLERGWEELRGLEAAVGEEKVGLGTRREGCRGRAASSAARS